MAIPLIASAAISAIPSLIKLFTSDDKTEAVVELAEQAGNALGIESGDPDDVLSYISDNPEAVVRLKELELDAEKLILEELRERYRHEERTTEMEIDDRKDARSRQIRHEEATGQTDYNLYVLAWLTVAGFFGLISLLIFVPLPPGSNNIVYMLLGALSTNATSVYQYFFGTSKGSSDKTKHLVEMGKK